MAACRPLSLAVVLVLVVAGSGCASGQPAQEPSGIHVSYGEDASSSMTVAWLGPPRSEARVEYGPTGDYGQTQQASSILPVASERASYVAEIDGLEPNTTYHYRVVTGGEASGNHTFTTAPEPGTETPVRVTAFGDHGTATEANRADGEAPVRNVELVASLEPDVHLLAGDLSYAEGRAEQWNRYVEQIQPLAAEVPFMTVPGNHEREGVSPEERQAPDEVEADEESQGFHQYDARFPMPTPGAEDERWWTVQHGDVFVVGLNTERTCEASVEDHGTPDDPAGNCEFHPGSPYEPQLSFFEQALARAADAPTVNWTVVLAHHAFWSSGGHGSIEGLQEHYMPVIDEHGVDVVVQGHDHLYERTKLLREGEVAEEGTLYVTNGAGGSGFYDWEGEQPAWSAARDNTNYGTLVLDFAGDELTGRFVSLDGGTLDAFSLTNAEDGLRSTASPGADPDGEDPSTETASPVPGAGVALAVGVATALAAAARRRRR